MLQAQVYTPDQVAQILQLNKNTVYELIKRGEIIAKKIGKVFRVPAISLSFTTTGLDNDLYVAERQDLKLQPMIKKELSRARKAL